MNAKVQINKQDRAAAPAAPAETASQQLTRQVKTTVDVDDARGRTIRLKKPNAIAKLRFIEAMGESSTNKLWAATVWPLMNVISIDGVANSVPITKQEIEALYQRLDEDGMDAVGKGLTEMEGGDDIDAEAAKK